MTDTTNDFARLFRIEGIGQVLVTIDANDEADDLPCLTFRLPSFGPFTPSYSLTSRFPEDMSQEEQDRHMQTALQAVTEDMIRREALPIADMAREMAGIAKTEAKDG